jgi:5'-nucleotidase
MRILVTNDDGIEAEGIKVLAQELRKSHEVWVIAPDRERSGASHSVTLKDPGRLQERGEREYSCSGTPADCVMLGFLGALPFVPDIVVAGINRGPNLGTDILYSGTCAAARQAALYGLPGIAVSCATRQGPFLYGASATFISEHIEKLMDCCSQDVFINVNAPSQNSSGLDGIWASVSRRHYHDGLKPFRAPDGATYCFIEPGQTESIGESHSDEAVVAAGMVAVTSVLVHPQVSPRGSFGAAFL